MKIFEAKSVIEALENASKELNIPLNEIHYIIRNNKLDEKAIIEVYSLDDVCVFGKEYLKNVINNLNIDVEIDSFIKDNEIYINVDSEKKSILIGKNGKTLKAFDELISLAISSNFKRKFNVFFDIGNYKEKKYSRITNFVKQAAIEVVEKHNEIKIKIADDLEKKIVYQTLKKFNDIFIENVGFGDNHSILIRYANKNSNKNAEKIEGFNNKNDVFTSINNNHTDYSKNIEQNEKEINLSQDIKND